MLFEFSVNADAVCDVSTVVVFVKSDREKVDRDVGSEFDPGVSVVDACGECDHFQNDAGVGKIGDALVEFGNGRVEFFFADSVEEVQVGILGEGYVLGEVFAPLLIGELAVVGVREVGCAEDDEC